MDWIQIKYERAWICLPHHRLSIHKSHNTMYKAKTCHIKSCIQVAAAAEAPLYSMNPNYKYDAKPYQVPDLTYMMKKLRMVTAFD